MAASIGYLTGMLAFLHDWQELASGVLALAAGGFIFIQGHLERQETRRNRADDVQRSLDEDNLLLRRLREAALNFGEVLDDFVESLEDVLNALDRGDERVEVPRPVTLPRVFSTIFAQIASRPIASEVYFLLSELIERGESLDADMRRLLVTFGETVVEHRVAQPGFRFPISGLSKEPAVQIAMLSVRSMQDLTLQISNTIDVIIATGDEDGSDLRGGVQAVGRLQHEPPGKAHR